MKYIYLLLFLVLFNSCKDDAAAPVVAKHDYIGWLVVSDSTGDAISNQSNVKVTALETGAISYSDSAGFYKFTGLPEGTYSFKYEYKNYSVFYLQNVILNGSDGSVIHAKDLDEISPNATHSFILDSTTYGIAYSTVTTKNDTTLNLYFRRFNSFPIRFSNRVTILSKSKLNLDYYSGKYDKIFGTSSSGLVYQTDTQSLYTFLYDSLKNWGFKSGDSICIKYYAVNSTSYYVDKTTGKRVYPFLGSVSNVYATKLK